MKNTRKAGVLFIFITLFLDILGIGLIVPLLPELVTHFFGNSISEGARYYGILLVSYSLMQFFFAPFLGALSDRFGRRPVLLISSLGSAVDYLVMAFAPNYIWLLAARMVSGITGANITVGTAYLADVTPPEKRAQSFGLLGAAFGLGFILGPAMGGLLGQTSLSLPFLVAAGLTLLNFLYGLLILPESLVPEHRSVFEWKKANPLGAFKLLTRTPVLLNLSLIYLLANLAQRSIESTWVLFTKYRFAWTPMQNGLSLAAVGVCAALVQGGLIRRLIPKWGERKAIVIGTGVGILTFLLFAWAPFGWTIYVIIVFNSLLGIAGPAAQGVVSRQVSPSEQGALQGALASLGTLTRIIGPLVATSLFGYFTDAKAPARIDGISFILGAVLLTASLFVTLNLYRKYGSELEKPAEEPVSNQEMESALA
ncbi:tetracycline resistance MFS efflux pump [bacterium (Candidatus Blackallbacteria) CG17_big_fil_post_rev_8_21_14_2_50_48_46]|uniref:Tetracycline resistance MFS efflux pump n=1 Tax=bacterium (Candidatus Blackallbacteria) CG17_big_fil_post_rev_8_21_14_2_50_48_46 TaxID=2014261 RepID=A0A2M7FYM8_9BACT|nr:MAG: tetracycline resistance MFS efflux pump [bacterium (Candidatus Blackallbacteria) CG18_big_fil_WC_8_21_14_2_50_49_26]PIW14484.1 MAG: tetracycline resistance MFS efflux pump [bacterium (Candidatus Blackallbacteria) CG17_big_fil_post_rev_8_21_14_2_50_48_46]PIW47170.1 MAG: tetracycline resistance MFS efflux pump [bacterium (Candidatus Blackallbacteria) CG13_big_fil_rev_8_21_14_2_50_49_14]